MYSKEFGIGSPITDIQTLKGVKSTEKHPVGLDIVGILDRLGSLVSRSFAQSET